MTPMRRELAAGNWKMNGTAGALAEVEAPIAGPVIIVIASLTRRTSITTRGPGRSPARG